MTNLFNQSKIHKQHNELGYVRPLKRTLNVDEDDVKVDILLSVEIIQGQVHVKLYVNIM